MNNNKMLISIIIPVHNEEGSLPQLIEELDSVISEVAYSIEVIFVNDMSTDNTSKTLKDFKQKYSYVKVIDLSKRGGQTGCYQVAFQEAKCKYIIRMDGDLQDNPCDLYKFFPLIEQDVDLIMGLRELRKHKKLIRFASILYDSLVVLLFDSPLHTNTSSYIAFKAKYIKGLKFKKNDHRHLTLIAMRRGATRIKEVIVVNRERTHGTSKYSNFRKVLFGIPEVIRFFGRIILGYYDPHPIQGEEQ